MRTRALASLIALLIAFYVIWNVAPVLGNVSQQLPQVVVDAILLGNLYFLIAVGITLTYTVAKFANFAHGDVATAGAYAAYLIYNFAIIAGIINNMALSVGIISLLLGILLIALWKMGGSSDALALGVPSALTGLAILWACFLQANLVDLIIISASVSALTSVLSHVLVYRPLSRRGATLVQLMVASIGVALFVRYFLYELAWYSRTYFNTEIMYQNFGINLNSFQAWLMNNSLIVANTTASFISDYVPALSVGAQGIRIIKVPSVDLLLSFPQPLLSFTDLHVWSTVTVLVILIAMTTMFKKTKIGKAWRAVADNPVLAAACGIDVDSVINLAWLVAGALAGIGGLFWAMQTQIYPELGWMVLLNAFAVAVLGGLGSFWGTFVASYLLAFAEQLGVSILASIDPQLTGYRFMIPFSVFLLVLFVKPEGIAGIRRRKA
ncbi:branched-chain amino acid ABC transporter permease [Ignicoccus hospitalis]|uniref:Inner-membrane translocator n=1 Tax=Ignicoccus hospitalis (strain KIN4/I / DSM 18386 / JCM 14125) TaxID=453591 RepID=A8AAF9_IGNH4|nr:branched-chain amino acid ABC transporter permease [Ignicoccus hospitalis]ABU81911.1 inner-membrane translocator [Ignicoccus hospitalis KIN4/I]HIH89931.1 branched-chain amino acid ABC transporter permease [Desulfurococcaceae archaeon]